MKESATRRSTEIVTSRRDAPGTKPLAVRITERGRWLGRGEEAQVYRVKVTAEHFNGRTVPLASKEFITDSSSFASYEEQFQNHKLVKDAGLPVPTTFRARNDEKGIFLTDLTEGGKNIVFSYPDFVTKPVQDLYEERTDQMNRFTLAESLDSEKSSKMLQAYAKKATDAGIIVGIDSWFLCIKTDGTYQFVVADLSHVSKRDDLEKEELLRLNTISLKTIQTGFSYIQKYGINPDPMQNPF